MKFKMGKKKKKYESEKFLNPNFKLLKYQK